MQLVIFHKMIMMYCSHSFSHGFFIIILSAQIDTKDGTILVDYSKNIITDETMKLLMNLVCQNSNILCMYVSRYIIYVFKEATILLKLLFMALII